MSLVLSERKELEQLLSETFAWIDHGQADQISKLCSEGFVLHAPGTEIALAQFEQLMTQRVTASYQTRHQWSNLRVLDADGDGAEVTYLVCIHRREAAAEVTTRSLGEFTDRWVRTPDGWHLASRTITPVLDAAA